MRDARRRLVSPAVFERAIQTIALTFETSASSTNRLDFLEFTSPRWSCRLPGGHHGGLSDRRHEDTPDLRRRPFACVRVSTDRRRLARQGLRIEGDPERELSQREVQVLERVALGHANREIADGLSISEGTVKNHLKNIARKLDARDRTHAVVLAMAAGLVDQPASLVEKRMDRLRRKG